MAQKTIDQLPAATTPLSGSDELPVWQGSSTKKVAVTAANLGLGTAATHASTDFDAAGSAATAQATAEAYTDAAVAPLAAGTHTTTDNTASVLVASYTPPVSKMLSIEVRFSARKQGGVDGYFHIITAGFLIDAAGVVTQVGSSLGGSSHISAGASSWSTSVTTDGTVIKATVSGQNSTSIDWVVEMEQAGLAP